jgi:quercetin dioxygenase-like cupin family protein
MKNEHYTATPAELYGDLKGVSIRWVIDQDDDAPNFAMRVIEVEPGCNTPYHTHDFEHEVFVLAGEGHVRDADENEQPIAEGSVVYVHPNEPHGFYNTGNDIMRFICVIPHQPKG